MLAKYASAVILSVESDAGARINKTAHRHSFDYTPEPGYLYIRSRAISSRCNDNFDEFPAEEIKKSYATFVGKPVFVNHHNENHRRARGVIIDAALHEDQAPDGSPDTWVEVLMMVDAVRFPKLAKAILAGHVDRTSMGTDVAFSKCGVCGNKASTPLEYCQHIPALKGKRIYKTTASGSKEGVLVREICYGLRFFENSLLVEEPADPTAYFLGVEAGPGVVGPKAVKVAVRKQADHGPDEDSYDLQDHGDGKGEHFHVPIDQNFRDEIKSIRDAADFQHSMHQQYQKTPVNTNDHADLLHHMLTAHDGHDSLQGWSHPELQEEHDNEHREDMSYGEEAAEWPDAVNMEGHHFHEAKLQTKALSVESLNNPYGDAYQPPLTPISDCKSCTSPKGKHCTRGCKGVRLYRGTSKTGALFTVAISDEELAKLTTLPPLDLKQRGTNGHCKRCGAPLANSLESSVGICPACEDGGGRRQPQRQRQKLVRTNGGGVEKQSSLQKEAIPSNIAGWKQRSPGEDPLDHIKRVTSAPNAARYGGGPVPYYRNVNFQANADGSHSVQHHNTEIMRFHPDGNHVTMNTGGWMSKGTRDLFHHFLNSDLSEDRRSFQIEGRTRRNGWEDSSNPRFHPGGPWTVHTHGPAEEHPEYGFMRPGSRQDSHEYHDGMTLNRVTGDHQDDHRHCFTPGNGEAGTYDTDPASGAPHGGWDADSSRSFNPTRNRSRNQGREWNGYGGTSGLGQGGRDVDDHHDFNGTMTSGCRTCGMSAGHAVHNDGLGDDYNGRGGASGLGQGRETRGDGLGYEDEYGNDTGPRRNGLTSEERRELQRANRSRPNDLDYGPNYSDTAHSWSAPTGENPEGPKPGESLEEWMRRVPSKPKFDKCPDCRGKGTVRDSSGTRGVCNSCEGHGYQDTKGNPYDPENPNGQPRPQTDDQGNGQSQQSMVDHVREGHGYDLTPQRQNGMGMTPNEYHNSLHRSHFDPGHSHGDDEGPSDHDVRNGLGGDGPEVGTCEDCHQPINVGSHGPTSVISHDDGRMYHGHHGPFADAESDPDHGESARIQQPRVPGPENPHYFRGSDARCRMCGNFNGHSLHDVDNIDSHWGAPSDHHEYHASGNTTGSPCSTCGEEALSDSHMNPRTSMKHHALGETVAPRDVDTLRDEECPVCAEKDSYDGDTCQVCGFVKPPAMFMDPNTDIAKGVDLRKDNPGMAGPGGDPMTPGGNQANPMDPNAVDAQGMPAEVPGSGTPGTDAVPIDPNMVDGNGNQVPGQMSQDQQVGPDGQPMIDPNTGLPLQGQPTGPTDIYGQPLGPEGPLSAGEQQPVDQATGLPIDPVTGQPTDMAPLSPDQLQANVPGQGMQPVQPGQQGGFQPGMAPDGQMEDPARADQNSPQLMCPACGFTTVAAAPSSLEMPMGEPTGNVSDGAQVGDVCPQCGAALLVSADQAQGVEGGGEMADEQQFGAEEAEMGEEEAETGQLNDAPQESNPFGDDDSDGEPNETDPNNEDPSEDGDDEDPEQDKKAKPFGG